MVSPFTVDVQKIPADPFKVEAATFHQGFDRTLSGWMLASKRCKPKCGERESEQLLEALLHVAVTLIGFTHIIAQGGVLKGAADNVVDVNHTNNAVIVRAADRVTLMIAAADAL